MCKVQPAFKTVKTLSGHLNSLLSDGKAKAKMLSLLFAISTHEEDRHNADISYMHPDVKTLGYPQLLDMAFIHITSTVLPFCSFEWSIMSAIRNHKIYAHSC